MIYDTFACIIVLNAYHTISLISSDKVLQQDIQIRARETPVSPLPIGVARCFTRAYIKMI